METFGFLLHPMDLEDVKRRYKIARKVPPKIIASALRRRKPFVLSEITGVKSKAGAEAKGWFVTVPFLPNQFFDLKEEYVLDKIVKASDLAHEAGAGIVGLGAFTALVGDGGREIARRAQVPITTGNTYTVATAIHGTKKAAEAMGIDLASAVLAIVGATGSIGSASSEMLAPEVGELRLIGRNEEKLSALGDRLKPLAKNVTTHTDVTAVRQADVVIAVTGSADAIINAADLKPGSVVCDVARPRDVSELVIGSRNDVLVIDGGVVQVPGDVDFHFNFGLPAGMALACMAETMLLALEKRYECYTLGKEISVEKIREMEALAVKHGFSLAALRSFERAISDETIDGIRKNAKKQRALA
ncbi:MAG: polysaccharide biosynthesis protein [Chloroflexi bacterium]|nr:polysaccharide biosynthesis protein [Chloroflexota bacterium]